MKEKRTLILLGVLLLLVVAGGGWFLFGKSNQTSSTKIEISKIRKQAPKRVVKRTTLPKSSVPKITKKNASAPTRASTIPGMFPIGPGDNYIAGLIDVESFQKRMAHRLSPDDQATLKRMALKECGYVLWPTGIEKEFHYAVICSTTGNPDVVKKELTKKKDVVEGTCGKSTKCIKITNQKGKPIYLAFKNKRFLVLSDVASLVASMITTAPSPKKAEAWGKLLTMDKNQFGTLIGCFSPTEESGGVSDFTPSNLGKHSNVNISKLYIRGNLGFIPKGIAAKFKINLKDNKNKDIVLAKVPGKVTVFNPSLPSDALIAGVDFNALRRSVEATIERYKGKADADLKKLEGRVLFELSFNNGRPLVYLKVVDLKENGPILKKLGKPGDEVDITTMINPFLAMFLGKTDFKRIKGGFIATNLVGTNLTPSKAGLAKSKQLLQNLSMKNPLMLFSVSPQRFVEGAIALVKPFVAKNPEMQKNLHELEQKMKNKNRPERVVFLSNSLTDYEVRVEYRK